MDASERSGGCLSSCKLDSHNEFMTKKRIIISGSCWYEVSGLESVLKGEEYEIQALKDVTPSPSDVLLIALSAEPMLNWGRFLSALVFIRGRYRCQTIALVPGRLKNIHYLFRSIQTVDGSCSISELKKCLIGLISEKQQPMTSITRKQTCYNRVKFMYEAFRRPYGKKERNRYYYSRAKLVELTGMPNMHMLTVISPVRSGTGLTDVWGSSEFEFICNKENSQICM